MCSSFSHAEEAQMHSSERCSPNVLVSSAELPVTVGRLEAGGTHSSYSNHTSISWIQWLGKRQRSGALRALGGLQCNDDVHKLGHWEKEHGYGEPAVSMATTVLIQLLPPHLGKNRTIRKRCVLLCAGWIIKYTPSVANSLLPPPHSGAFHLLPSDFGGGVWLTTFH